MTTNAKLGYGGTFAKQTAAGPPAVFTNFAEVVSFQPPQPSVETVDATHMGSTDAYREFIAGLIDAGEVSFSANFTRADYATFLTDLNARAFVNYKITLSEGSTLTFTALPTGASIDNVEVDGKMTVACTFKVTGKPTFTAAA